MSALIIGIRSKNRRFGIIRRFDSPSRRFRWSRALPDGSPNGSGDLAFMPAYMSPKHAQAQDIRRG
jgi:hypothetical protein